MERADLEALYGALAQTHPAIRLAFYDAVTRFEEALRDRTKAASAGAAFEALVQVVAECESRPVDEHARAVLMGMVGHGAAIRGRRLAN